MGRVPYCIGDLKRRDPNLENDPEAKFRRAEVWYRTYVES